MRRIKRWWARLTKKAKPVPVRQDPYAPRRKNVIYPNDEFAQEHISRWLDDVFEKHHGQ